MLYGFMWKSGKMISNLLKHHVYKQDCIFRLSYSDIFIHPALTSMEYSTSSPSRPVSFSVYLAFFTWASTGPFSIWCFMARKSLYKGSPAESCRHEAECRPSQLLQRGFTLSGCLYLFDLIFPVTKRLSGFFSRMHRNVFVSVPNIK